MTDTQTSEIRPIASVLVPVVAAGYVVWSITAAARHGMFRWGSLGDYSLFVYVLVLAQVASAVAFCRLRDSSLYTSLIICLGCGSALTQMRPIDHIPPQMWWAFDIVGYVAVCAVILATGVTFSRGRR